MAITSFTAGEAISAGNAVFVSSSGFLYKSTAVYLDQASVVGLSIDSGSAGALIRVNSDDIYTSASGLTPGEYRYASILTSGQTVSYAGWASDLALTSYDGAYLTIVGRAITSSGVEVETSKPLFIANPTSVFLLETSTGGFLDAILQEDGSTINLEIA